MFLLRPVRYPQLGLNRIYRAGHNVEFASLGNPHRVYDDFVAAVYRLLRI